MGLALDFDDGKTPLDEDEKEGLKIKTISSRSELDEFEQHNIEKAFLWLKNKKLVASTILSEKFTRDLHRHMYGDVWKWAGEFRKTNKNIGIDKHLVAVSLKQLLDDCAYWVQQQSYTPAEVAVRLKHKIVQIHCFANGNGRHSRLLADVMMEKIFHLSPFTWGAGNLVKPGEARAVYLKALKKADGGDYADLLAFAVS